MHKPIYDEQIIALRKQKHTVAEIAERLGITGGTVCNRLKAHGLNGQYVFSGKMYKKADTRKPYKKHRKMVKQSTKTEKKRAFSLHIVGNSEVIHVLPTSYLQFLRLLRLLQKEGGEVI